MSNRASFTSRCMSLDRWQASLYPPRAGLRVLKSKPFARGGCVRMRCDRSAALSHSLRSEVQKLGKRPRHESVWHCTLLLRSRLEHASALRADSHQRPADSRTEHARYDHDSDHVSMECSGCGT